MEVVSTAISLALGVASGAGSHELLANYLNEQGRPYREVFTHVLTPIFRSREVAEAVVTFAPVVAVPVVMMATRISIKEIIRMVTGKSNPSELTDEEQEALALQLDQMIYDHAHQPPSYRDADLHAGANTSSKGIKGREKRLQPEGITRTGPIGDKTYVQIVPHVHHDKTGLHLPK